MFTCWISIFTTGLRFLMFSQSNWFVYCVVCLDISISNNSKCFNILFRNALKLSQSTKTWPRLFLQDVHFSLKYNGRIYKKRNVNILSSDCFLTSFLLLYFITKLYGITKVKDFLQNLFCRNQLLLWWFVCV